MITRRLAYAACAVAAVALAAGFIDKGFAAGGATMILLGFAWMLGIRRRWGWVSPTLFLLFGVMSAIIYLIQSPAYLAVISLAAILVTWDLDHFQTRLERIGAKEMARSVESSHLLRLFTSVGVGALLTAAALLIHIQLSFAVALIAGAIALLALSQVIYRLAPPPGPAENKPGRPAHPFRFGGR